LAPKSPKKTQGEKPLDGEKKKRTIEGHRAAKKGAENLLLGGPELAVETETVRAHEEKKRTPGPKP